MSIFTKIFEYGNVRLDNMIQKAKVDIAKQDKPFPDLEPDTAIYGKAVQTDPTYSVNSQGYKDRRDRLNPEALRKIAYQDSIIAAIIQTRQNHVANFAKPSLNDRDAGFKVELKNYEIALEAMKLTIKVERDVADDDDKERLKELGVNPDKIEVKKPEVPSRQELKDDEPMKDQDMPQVDPIEKEQQRAQEEMEQKQAQMQALQDMNGNGNGEEEVEVEEKEEVKVKKGWETLRKANGDDDNPVEDEQAEEAAGEVGEGGEEGGMDPAAMMGAMNGDKPGDMTTPEEEKDVDDKQEEFDWALEREAKDRLDKEVMKRKKKIEDWLMNCGEKKDRPFESRKWTFNNFVRALVRDTLTIDLMAVEMVNDQAGRPHHFFPVDAATIRYATPQLKTYAGQINSQVNMDILYPEAEIEYLTEKTDAIELDPELLEDNEYKYVQVIRGIIERAYTPKELKVAVRNVTTDIYHNGYGIAELELLVRLVSSHLNTEYYNEAYFTQGFSAKGILHLKSPLNRRKLEAIRIQWQHMLKGSRNSFQTPIFAGMDDVNWIPLTQNHSDIEFQGWMNYLIKLICAIYQIDPIEIGYGMMEEGGGGGGLNGDNSSEKITLSRDKGLYPLMKWFEHFINTKLIDPIDPDFVIKFTGLSGEGALDALDRQERESKFKKTVNEIRAEDNLPPLPGVDNLIAGAEYLQWYLQFSPEAVKQQEQAASQEAAAAGGGEGAPPGEEEENPGMEEFDGGADGFGGNSNGDFLQNPEYEGEMDGAFGKSLTKKPIKIEYYK